MPHDTPLISTIVGGLVLAFALGALANRLRLPPLVGYLVAGIAVGPFTPGFVADGEMAMQLAEIGVILLMFGVGLHFSLKDLLSVRALAVPGAMVQIGGATLLGLGLALAMGWSVAGGLIFGLALSVASTVVLLKAMQDRRLIDSERGRLAVGWLIVEDLATVLALVLIPALASLGGGTGVELHDPFVSFVERIVGARLGLVGVLAVTLVKIVAFIGGMLVIGRRIIPYMLHATAHTGSRELFRLAVLAIALGVAAGASYLFGVSLALGAFFAGMVLSESELSHRAAQETLPLRDAFSVLFFVSVGMLFDPMIIVRNPLPVLATIFIVMVGKSLFAFVIVLAFRQPAGTALTISASLAQIGEFSFILAALGVGLGLMPAEGRDLILAGALISIILNPAVFWAAEWLWPRLEGRLAEPATRGEPRLEPVAESAPAEAGSAPAAPQAARAPTGLAGHAILIGYGRVGSVVAEGLLAARAPFVLIEEAEGRVEAARRNGIEVIAGNAASAEVLGLANAGAARDVVIAIPNAFEAGQAAEQCRRLNGALRIVVRAQSEEEASHLVSLGADAAILGAREIGIGMLGWLGDKRAEDFAAPVASDAIAAEPVLPQTAAPEDAAPEAGSLAVAEAGTDAPEPPEAPPVAPEPRDG